MASELIGRKAWPILGHSARTAVAAVASLLAARLSQLPETYWAPITTIVVTQSSLGAALTVSWQRFVGTAFGAAVGTLVASHFGPHALVFGASVFALGLLCAVTNADRSAYRFGGIALAIVLLVPRTRSPWQIAFDRFAEVSIGIGVALIFGGSVAGEGGHTNRGKPEFFPAELDGAADDGLAAHLSHIVRMPGISPAKRPP